jgi:DNA-directed RNA polymerase specialized sigma24 family protein
VVKERFLETKYHTQIDIAEELGLQLGTVKSRIHFSRKKLIDMIGSK